VKSNIDDLCDAFIAAITDAGYAQKNIENYRQVSNRLKKFCAENGYDTYTAHIGQMFADNVFNEKTGKFVRYRYVMYGRFIRLINSFYFQGAFDFSTVTKEKNLPTSKYLVQLYHDYTEHLKSQYSNIGTVGFFQNGILRLLCYMEKTGIPSLTDLSAADVIDYICSWSQEQQRNVLCILRNIFRYFGREDLYFVVAGIHTYRTKRIVPMFTDDEVASIKETLSLPCVSRRDAAIFLLGFTTGMRAADVVDLRLSNIDWKNETIFFQQSKTGNAVCLPLTTDIGNSIYRYILEERPNVDDDHIFLRSQAPFRPLEGHSTCYCIVSNILQRAGIQKNDRIWGMCMLRHNAASMMVQNSIPLTTIAAILGHTGTRTTDIYITTDINNLKECVLPLIRIPREVNP
jgi:integrase